jgi:hypothetical protein
LEDLVTTHITGIRVYEEEGLDFRDPSDDSPDGDKFTQMSASDCSYSKDRLISWGLEVEVAVEGLQVRIVHLFVQ